MERWLRKLLLRWRSLFRTRQVEAELDEELRFHLDTRTDQGLARGLALEEARRRAALGLEGVDQQKEACRDTRRTGWVEYLLRDARHGARLLAAQPGFTLAAVLSLALGIGANTAVFQVIDAVRLRALPVPRPGELARVEVEGGHPNFGVSSSADAQFTYPLWEIYRQQQQAFSHVFAWATTQMLVGYGADARLVRLMWLSGDAFSTLELAPAAGRLLTPDDDRHGCSPNMVLSHSYWQSQFAGDPGVTTRTLFLLDRQVPIVGVTPKSFFGLEVGSRFDIALPVCAQALWTSIDRRDWFWLGVIGRLKPGWTMDRAAAEQRAISPALFESTEPTGYAPDVLKRYLALRLTAVPGGTGVSGLRDQYGDALWLLLAMTGLVLVLACTNIMNLLLARATAREHEIALRVAIGASRGRIVSQLLVESLLLALIGAVTGVIIAHPLSAGLVNLVSAEGDPLYIDLQTHWPVLTFAFLTGVSSCVLFGLVPAIRAARMSPGIALKTGGRGMTSTRERLLAQRSLVVAQVAISLVLVVGAALFLKTFNNLASVDTGIDPGNLIVGWLADFSPGRPSPDEAAIRHDELLRTLRVVPGVASVASTTKVPLDGSSWTLAVSTPDTDPLRRATSKFTYVSSGYFVTCGIRLLAGRDFSEADGRHSKPVIIVNQTFVRMHLPRSNPLGSSVRTVAEPGYPETTYEIVGVVADTKYSGVREANRAIAFVPYVQHPSLGGRGWPQVLIRASGAPQAVMAGVRRAVVAAHPSMTVAFAKLDEEIAKRMIRERVMAWLAAAFGFVAAFLAFVGIYGVISYLVQRRRHELAMRLALGAGRARIVRLITGQLGVLLGIGLAIGIGLAFAGAWSASALLFGVSWHDAATIAQSLSLLVLIAAIAMAVPAARASQIRETSALRTD